MTLKDATGWNKRLAAVYAASVWTMIASYAFFKYTDRFDGAAGRDKQEELVVPDDKVKVMYKTPHSESVIISKKDFVPFTTRIYNFIFHKSSSSEPGTGDE